MIKTHSEWRLAGALYCSSQTWTLQRDYHVHWRFIVPLYIGFTLLLGQTRIDRGQVLSAVLCVLDHGTERTGADLQVSSRLAARDSRTTLSRRAVQYEELHALSILHPSRHRPLLRQSCARSRPLTRTSACSTAAASSCPSCRPRPRSPCASWTTAAPLPLLRC